MATPDWITEMITEIMIWIDETWVWFLAGAIIILLALTCIRVISPTEMGLVILLGGNIIAFIKKGIYFFPKGIFKIVKFTTTQLTLEYDVLKSVTRSGMYYPTIQALERAQERLRQVEEEKGTKYQEKLKKAEEELKKAEEAREKDLGEHCDSAELPRVGIKVYIRYPRSEDLKDTYEVLGEMNEEGLRKHYSGYVTGYVREIIGELVWREVVEHREKLVKKIELKFSHPASPFMVARFESKDIYLAVTAVELPPDLARLLTKPQEEKLIALSKKETAKGMAYSTMGANIAMMGISQGRDLDKNPYIYSEEKAQELSDSYVSRDQAGNFDALRQVEIKGVEGDIEKSVMGIIAASKSINPNPSTEKSKKEGVKKGEETRRITMPCGSVQVYDEKGELVDIELALPKKK